MILYVVILRRSRRIHAMMIPAIITGAFFVAMDYKLQFSTDRISELADRYSHNNTDQPAEDYIIQTISPAIQQQGFYSKDAFLKVCHWKTPRTQRHCVKNSESYIHEITSIALKTSEERLRIEVLTLLDGVDWPTASVFLHFGHSDPYPILDFRALWSLDIPEPNAYNFSFWSDYVGICRKLAQENGVSMRTLDRALWQYSNENQRTETASERATGILVS